MRELLKTVYTGIFDSKTIENIAEVALFKSFKKGDIILDIGQSIHFIPLVLNGAVKVMREDPIRGELLLYYLISGDTCTMTATCCTSNKISSIRVIADTAVDLAFIPNSYFNHWLSTSETWRNFILQSYSKRLDEMIVAVDSLAFSNMEERVITYLLQKMRLEDNRILTVTHAEIASDLNSSRVVISRILKKLESDEKILLLRNEIRILL
ncbi:Crp/Fnr family transcriptional regulator [Sphingobacterium litopenaei]|jgi:CRP/FNR family transcriptional regulator|uniref:Crp/Fnr family transcriptional regulator n=1 Tax=Sphingobacterium litopenaei TaxID=2763500 RepID=A0ABR7YGV4_9SPHI|nr:Crp/Fnr family transcriptional regulator [Sphingobacterium litopenaei]MBD1430556.1 Crp/Fnr family transcriptional regulator [Sphingobacterium litopenaei]